MVRLPINPPPRNDHPSSPESTDLDSFLLDFDPVSEWLVDPDLDLSPMAAPEEPVAPNPDELDPKPTVLLTPDELLGQSIDDKMEKVSLVETAEHLQTGAGEPRASPLAAMEDVAGDKGGVFMDSSVPTSEGDGIDVCSINDPIKTAHESEEESSESETDDSDESEDDSSSSDESSSSSSEEDDEGGGGEGKGDDLDRANKGGKENEKEEIEEGEIRDSIQDEVDMFSDEDFEVLAGPIKSKHETEVLPPVPQIEVCLEPHHQTLPVGVISSIMGARIIVEGSEKHNPLSEGSVVWITETRLPLGLVDEIFGPVKTPYYVVRHNSEKEVPVGISVGTAVSFVKEFASYVLNEKDLYKKGYDASGENDEEMTDEAEFSDDEKEAEYRRSLRQSKRAANDTRHRDQGSPIDKRTNSKGSPSSGRWHTNQEFLIDKKTTKFKGGSMNDRRHSGNRDAAIDKRTDFTGAASSDRWHGNRESGIDKRTNFMGATAQKCMRTRMPSAPRDQLMPSVPAPPHVQPTAANFGRGNFFPLVGPGNAFGSTPALPPAILQPMQLGTCFIDPFQQLLQQTNALLQYGFPAQLQHMNIQGGVQMNSLPSQQFIPNLEPPANIQGGVQMNSINQQQQQQQQVFNCFPNVMPFQQQFIPNLERPVNMPLLGGLLNLSSGQTSLEALGQSTACQPPIGYYNMQGQGVSGSFSAQNYGQPPSTIVQSNIRPLQFNPSTDPMLFGPQGQSNTAQELVGNSKMQEQAVSCNAQSFRQPVSFNQGGMHPPLQLNQSIGPGSLGSAGQNSVSQAPSGCSNLSVQGVPGSCNAESQVQFPPAINQCGIHPMQLDPTIVPTSLGSLGQSSIKQGPSGCNAMQEQGPSGSCSKESYGQPPPVVNQQGMYPPMQFNSSNGPQFIQPAGQSSVGQVQFVCSNMDQGSSSSSNAQSYGQSPASNDQGMMCPAIQFNPGRSSSSSRGRNHYQRGRPFFKRGGRWRNG